MSEEYANKLMGKAQTGTIGKKDFVDFLNDHDIYMQACRTRQQREEKQQQKLLNKQLQMPCSTDPKTTSPSSSKYMVPTAIDQAKTQGTYVVTVSLSGSPLAPPSCSSLQPPSGSRNNQQPSDGDSESDSEIQVREWLFTMSNWGCENLGVLKFFAFKGLGVWGGGGTQKV